MQGRLWWMLAGLDPEGAFLMPARRMLADQDLSCRLCPSPQGPTPELCLRGIDAPSQLDLITQLYYIEGRALGADHA